MLFTPFSVACISCYDVEFRLTIFVSAVLCSFVRGPATFVDPVVRDSAPKNVPNFFWYGSGYGVGFKDAYERVANLYKGESLHLLLNVAFCSITCF